MTQRRMVNGNRLTVGVGDAELLTEIARADDRVCEPSGCQPVGDVRQRLVGLESQLDGSRPGDQTGVVDRRMESDEPACPPKVAQC